MEEPCPAASSEGTPKDGSSTSPWRPTGVRSRAPMRRAVSWVLRGLRDHRAKPDHPVPLERLAPLVPQVRRVTEATPARKAIPETRDLPELMDPKVLQARLDRLVPPENEARWAKRVLRELMDHPAPLARSLALKAMLAQQVHKDYRVLLAQPELKDPRAILAASVRLGPKDPQVPRVRPVRPVVLVLKVIRDRREHPGSPFPSEPS